METLTPRLTWRKSSYSSSQGDHCVELADLNGVIGIRDSKDPQGPKLVMDADEFAALVAAMKSSSFELR